MATVVRRTVLSIPHRDAIATWSTIVRLLAPDANSTPQKQLMEVAGIASSLIADRAPKLAPIVATCDGPRTRIYCVYDDEAMDDSETDESPLGFDALAGDWRVSLPCLKDDLDWLQAALKPHAPRITVRDADSDHVPINGAAPNAVKALLLDHKSFLQR